ncbi:efflux RND transporter periplasmic adaptor subunit [Sneathiella sp. P13V-1]|uniref:efflux RND transporter periplasmic adaptor subunit n=1 Tax=Sneathiella sp. P13V-1 TaxID=2697366 RepID=UPI00187B4F25|nr:efflux RND transporter periplasmic adaptor subunit [Sneathiella sp. P13V-1]MBE7637933.1 efflux RND transporter periplasmic adaptor subunit [Sneathiella sp. P13V-1]
MKITTQLIILIAIGAAAFAGWKYQDQIPFLSEEAADNSKGGKRGGRPVAVIAVPVGTADLKSTITAVGTLEANQSVNLTSKISAIIKNLAFKEGAKVSKGQLLVALDATEVRAEMAESQAELENSRKLYERTLKLYKSGNAPKARVDLQLSEMKVAEAKVQADQARLNEYEIRAPFDGAVGFHEVSVGSLVRPGDMITTLDDVNTLKLDFGLPEAFLATVKPGQSFLATSVAYKGRVFEGKVQAIASRVDPVTRIVKIRGTLSNPDGALRPGMYLSVSLETGFEKAALMVPEHAIIVSPAGSSLFVATEDGTAKMQEIILGQRRRGWVQVVDGISIGDKVVVEGLQKIRNGSKLKVTIEELEYREANAENGVGQ